MLWLVILACSADVPLEPAPVRVPGPAPTPAPPAWKAEISALSPEVRTAMTGVSWREGCPVALDDLRQITLSHYTFEGAVAAGELIVAATVADTVVEAFKSAFEAEYPINSMRPIRHFAGDDDRSMDADNTSAFNCRNVAGGRSWSQHSYGTAIDVNPVENPYINRSGTVSPKAARAFVDREQTGVPAMLTAESALVVSFVEAGWGWGGQWSSLKDYQHLSESGR